MLLMLYPRMRLSELVGTDLVQAVPLVTSAAIGHLLFGSFKLGLTGAILIGSVPGVFIGARFSSRAPDYLIRPSLIVVLLLSGMKLIGIVEQILEPRRRRSPSPAASATRSGPGAGRAWRSRRDPRSAARQRGRASRSGSPLPPPARPRGSADAAAPDGGRAARSGRSGSMSAPVGGSVASSSADWARRCRR